MQYARLTDHTVTEVIDFSPEGRFTPEIVAEFEPVPDEIAFGWTHNPATGEWLAPPEPPEPAPPAPPTLDEARARKLTEFEAVFTRLDALKIRPAASITEAISKGQTPDPGDVYVLSETQAITEENRQRRDLVVAAETVDAVREVEVWWPE